MTIQVTTPANILETNGEGAPLPKDEPTPEVKAKVEPEEAVKEPEKTPADAADDDLTGKARKAVNKKHREMMEAQEFAKRAYEERIQAEKRAEDLQAQIDALKSEGKAPPADATDVAPRREDFENDAKYWEALIDFKADQKVKASEKAREEREQKAHFQKLEEARIARNVEFSKTVDDYQETLEALQDADIRVPAHIGAYLDESDMSPAIMYHFAKNLDDLKRVVGMSPIRAIAELGKLEATITAPKKAAPEPSEKTPVSRAPAPIEPLGTSNAPVITDPSKMTFAQLREYDRAQRLKKAERR